MTPKEKIDSVWNSIWKDILENPDGTPDMDSIKRELHDYAILFKSVQTAYSRLTGGRDYPSLYTIGCSYLLC